MGCGPELYARRLSAAFERVSMVPFARTCACVCRPTHRRACVVFASFAASAHAGTNAVAGRAVDRFATNMNEHSSRSHCVLMVKVSRIVHEPRLTTARNAQPQWSPSRSVWRWSRGMKGIGRGRVRWPVTSTAQVTTRNKKTGVRALGKVRPAQCACVRACVRRCNGVSCAA
jgi:hypothetical protein